MTTECATTDQVLVRVSEVSLSDGSTVYNVSLGGLLGGVLHAVSKQDAYALADKIADAIDAHTVDLGRVD